jgi:hypothetical protein
VERTIVPVRFGATASAVISMRPREWRGKVMQTCLEPRAA